MIDPVLNSYALPGTILTSNNIIIKEVVRYFNVPYTLVNSDERTRELVDARIVMASMLLYNCQTSKNEKKLSYTAIGKFVGNKNHSTIWYYLKQVHSLTKNNKIFRNMVQEICTNSNVNYNSFIAHIGEHIINNKRNIQ